MIKEHYQLLFRSFLFPWFKNPHKYFSRHIRRSFMIIFLFLFSATDEQDFRDNNSYYRFMADDVFEPRDSRRATSAAQLRNEFVSKQQLSCMTHTVSVWNNPSSAATNHNQFNYCNYATKFIFACFSLTILHDSCDKYVG